jgi:hypothetical protein
MARDGAQSRLLLNLGLLVLVGVLGGLTYWAANRAPQSTTDRVSALSAESVEHIVIRRDSGPDIELWRDGQAWRMTAPFEMPASPFRSGQIAGLLERTSHARYEASDLELARYGLAPPRVTVTLDDTVIALGDANPVNNHRYLLLGGQVHLIDDTLFDALEGDASNFIDTRLLPDGAVIADMTLPDVRLSRGEDGAWTLDPEQPELSSDDVQSVLDEWQRTSALWVKPYQEAPPLARVVVRLADGEEMEFVVTRREPDLVLARPRLGIQYRLMATKAETLLELRPRSEPGEEQAPTTPG